MTRSVVLCVEYTPIVRETGVQSKVESYQRLRKFYLMSACLKVRIIIYWSRVKGSNPGKENRPLFHLGKEAIEKEAFRSSSITVASFTSSSYRTNSTDLPKPPSPPAFIPYRPRGGSSKLHTVSAQSSCL